MNQVKVNKIQIMKTITTMMFRVINSLMIAETALMMTVKKRNSR